MENQRICPLLFRLQELEKEPAGNALLSALTQDDKESLCRISNRTFTVNVKISKILHESFLHLLPVWLNKLCQKEGGEVIENSDPILQVCFFLNITFLDIYYRISQNNKFYSGFQPDFFFVRPLTLKSARCQNFSFFETLAVCYFLLYNEHFID